jgi:hypothetical protein
MNQELEQKIGELIERLDVILPRRKQEPRWECPAFRWTKRTYLGVEVGELREIDTVSFLDQKTLKNVERQKEAIFLNTEQFVKGFPANNVLLTGARGTGKSSLIRAALTHFYPQGLRLIEVGRENLADLGDIAAMVRSRPERFIVFCDDLSFEMGEGGYRELKAALDGSLAGASDNMLIYATSNRRHLMPEYMSENLTSSYSEDGDLHPAETIEEKLSLSERFGLWLSFYPFAQDEYLEIAATWIGELGGSADGDWERQALQFSLKRGSRSGRIAYQFAKNWVGSQRLKK